MQLKNKKQLPGETLQQFEIYVARLVRLVYTRAPRDFLDKLTLQTSTDGLRDVENQRVLKCVHPMKTEDALARVLEHEAAYQASKSYLFRRQTRLSNSVQENSCGSCWTKLLVIYRGCRWQWETNSSYYIRNYLSKCYILSSKKYCTDKNRYLRFITKQMEKIKDCNYSFWTFFPHCNKHLTLDLEYFYSRRRIAGSLSYFIC